MHASAGAPLARIVLFARLATSIALAAFLSGCGASHDSPQRALALSPCRLERLPLAAQCGELEVLEDRGKADGRRITIGVAVLPANTLNPRPDPLFVLAGGPG